MEIKKKLQYLKQQKVNILYKLLQCVGLVVVMWALNNVVMFDVHNPFGVVFAFSLIWCGYNPLVVGVGFAGTFYLANMTRSSINIAIAIFVICLAILFIRKWKGWRKGNVSPYILSIIGFIPYIVEMLGDPKRNVTLVISLVFAMFFIYILQYFMKGTLRRGYSLRLNIDEKICGGIILAVIAYGIAGSIPGVDISTIICVVVVLLSTYVYGLIESVTIGFVIGVGVSLYYFNPIYISFYLCFAFFCYAFRSKTRIFSAISMIIVYSIFTLYFAEYLIFDVVVLLIISGVSILFCFVPSGVINYFKDIFAGSKDKIAVRNMLKSNKDMICGKLLDMANVFKEMEFSFKKTIRRTTPLSEKKELIKQDLVHMVCKDCINKSKCLRINGEVTTKVFDSMVDAGINKGMVSDVDVNKYLLTRCSKVQLLVNCTNELVASYRETVALSRNMDNSKILVAEQFAGVSDIMHGLIEELSEDVTFDVDLENKIIEDLLYKNVFCEEAIVYDRSTREKSVILLVKQSKIDRSVIEKIVSKACKTQLKIVSIEPSQLPNVSLVTMQSTPNYDVVFGSATRNKAGVIVGGDTHSFVKIDNGKYMLALSDGMGSGETARETSDLAIGLIENYYKAGFDNDLILSSVNKLLSVNNEDNFSAIDICILDFFQNTMDFIKLATPYSYIKKKAGVEEIKSSGLPIGILEEIRPHVTKKYIENFDIVILVSDGVCDAVGTDNLKHYINNINMINPQDIADNILAKAIGVSHGVCADDMTVIVARIFPTK